MSENATRNTTYQSKSLRLAEVMRQDILSGVFRGREYMLAEEQLSSRYKASRSTVRRVLSILISDGTLVREPNKTVRCIGEKTISSPPEKLTFGFAFAGVQDRFMIEITEGIKDFCSQNNCRIQTLANSLNHENIIDMLYNAPELGMHGMIVLPYETPGYRNAIQHLLNMKFPLVCIDRRPDDLQVHSIEVDNAGAVHLAVSSMIARCQRPVYFVGETPNNRTIRSRMHGFKTAMFEAGYFNNIDQYFVLYPATCEDPEFWTEKMFEEPTRKLLEFFSGCCFPVSLFCASDYVAYAAYKAAEQMHLKIGEDIAVCGFDDLPLAQKLNPPLSSIEQPRRRLGFEAAELLCKVISAKVSNFVNLSIPVELHERASTGKK